jgi:hypothetical protein
MAPAAVAHFEVSADQRVDDLCSCVQCGEYESSIIYKEKSEIAFCYTPVREGRTKASIRVPRMFKSHVE